MRRLALFAWTACAAILPFSSISKADSPATRPAQIAVAVRPFDVLSDGSKAWIGKALQEGLASDFQQRGMEVVAAPSDADYVVTGTVQIASDQMRISGRLATTSGNKTIAPLHCDGSVRDLFSIEDSLSSKIDRLLSPQTTAATPAASLTLVGPTLPSPSRYFDGNIAATLTIPNQFQAEADRYNYHPTPFFYYGYFGYYGYSYYGYGYGYWPAFGLRFGGSPQAGLGTW